MYKDNCVIQQPEVQINGKHGVETRLEFELNYTVHFHRCNFFFAAPINEHAIIHHRKFHVTTASTAFQRVACCRRRPARYNHSRQIQAILRPVTFRISFQVHRRVAQRHTHVGR